MPRGEEAEGEGRGEGGGLVASALSALRGAVERAVPGTWREVECAAPPPEDALARLAAAPSLAAADEVARAVAASDGREAVRSRAATDARLTLRALWALHRASLLPLGEAASARGGEARLAALLAAALEGEPGPEAAAVAEWALREAFAAEEGGGAAAQAARRVVDRLLASRSAALHLRLLRAAAAAAPSTVRERLLPTALRRLLHGGEPLLAFCEAHTGGGGEPVLDEARPCELHAVYASRAWGEGAGEAALVWRAGAVVGAVAAGLRAGRLRWGGLARLVASLRADGGGAAADAAEAGLRSLAAEVAREALLASDARALRGAVELAKLLHHAAAGGRPEWRRRLAAWLADALTATAAPREGGAPPPKRRAARGGGPPKWSLLHLPAHTALLLAALQPMVPHEDPGLLGAYRRLVRGLPHADSGAVQGRRRALEQAMDERLVALGGAPPADADAPPQEHQCTPPPAKRRRECRCVAPPRLPAQLAALLESLPALPADGADRLCESVAAGLAQWAASAAAAAKPGDAAAWWQARGRRAVASAVLDAFGRLACGGGGVAWARPLLSAVLACEQAASALRARLAELLHEEGPRGTLERPAHRRALALLVAALLEADPSVRHRRLLEGLPVRDAAGRAWSAAFSADYGEAAVALGVTTEAGRSAPFAWLARQAWSLDRREFAANRLGRPAGAAFERLRELLCGAGSPFSRHVAAPEAVLGFDEWLRLESGAVGLFAPGEGAERAAMMAEVVRRDYLGRDAGCERVCAAAASAMALALGAPANGDAGERAAAAVPGLCACECPCSCACLAGGGDRPPADRRLQDVVLRALFDELASSHGLTEPDRDGCRACARGLLATAARRAASGRRGDLLGALLREAGRLEPTLVWGTLSGEARAATGVSASPDPSPGSARVPPLAAVVQRLAHDAELPVRVLEPGAVLGLARALARAHAPAAAPCMAARAGAAVRAAPVLLVALEARRVAVDAALGHVAPWRDGARAAVAGWAASSPAARSRVAWEVALLAACGHVCAGGAAGMVAAERGAATLAESAAAADEQGACLLAMSACRQLAVGARGADLAGAWPRLAAASAAALCARHPAVWARVFGPPTTLAVAERELRDHFLRGGVRAVRRASCVEDAELVCRQLPAAVAYFTLLLDGTDARPAPAAGMACLVSQFLALCRGAERLGALLAGSHGAAVRVALGAVPWCPHAAPRGEPAAYADLSQSARWMGQAVRAARREARNLAARANTDGAGGAAEVGTEALAALANADAELHARVSPWLQ